MVLLTSYTVFSLSWTRTAYSSLAVNSALYPCGMIPQIMPNVYELSIHYHSRISEKNVSKAQYRNSHFLNSLLIDFGKKLRLEYVSIIVNKIRWIPPRLYISFSITKTIEFLQTKTVFFQVYYAKYHVTMHNKELSEPFNQYLFFISCGIH